jgi:hypothetical protein
MTKKISQIKADLLISLMKQRINKEISKVVKEGPTADRLTNRILTIIVEVCDEVQK